MGYAINLSDAATCEDLGRDSMILLTDFYDLSQKSTHAKLTLKGDVPKDSALGYLIRMGWVTVKKLCVPECWHLHCPKPEEHRREFRLNDDGRDAGCRLTRKALDIREEY